MSSSSLDADFLFEGPASLILTKAFSQKRRDPENDFSRLYVVESAPTITGAKADTRWQRKPSGIVAFAQELADAVLHGATSGSDGDAAAGGRSSATSGAAASSWPAITSRSSCMRWLSS